ncbi:C40 family peptidase [Propionibacterium australiense]|uniref:C40 family peptidase n=1 Tax=Propionibacterium australiense TaxID=119981 RepID=UPI001E2E24BC|nr:C40 family peptidase [Propionibacterium australiense]
MTARRALLNDDTTEIEIVETAEPAATPRRAVMPSLAEMAVASADSRDTTTLHAVGDAKVAPVKSRRRFVAPVTAVAAASAIGVISTLVPAAAAPNPSADDGTLFQSNALAAVEESRNADDALNGSIGDLAALKDEANSAAAGAAANAAASEQQKKEEAEKAAAAALAEQEAATSNTATTTAGGGSTASAPSVTASSASAQAAVDFALAQLGKPYVYGASGPSGYDCSGLMMAAYASAGVSIPRTSQAQMAGLTSVSLSNLQPGDLVFFYGGSHVGMYIGNGQVVHAPTEGDVVKIADMNSMGPTSAARVAG